jgi:hypothetical protein
MCVCGVGLEIHKMMIIPKKFSSAGSTSGIERERAACVYLVAGRGRRTYGRKTDFSTPGSELELRFEIIDSKRRLFV